MSRINRLTTERNDMELECMHKASRIASLAAEVEAMRQAWIDLRGGLVDLIGDAEKGLFASPQEAVLCALELIDATMTIEQEEPPMPADPIDRREAKEELLAAVLEESRIAHVKCGSVVTNDENFQLGRHGGLMWAYYAIANAALDKLPALDADGRWEKLRTFVECQTRKVGPVEIFIAAYEEVLKEMDRLTSGDAAKREG